VNSLDRDVIFQKTGQNTAEKLRYLTVLGETDSTNSALLRLPAELRHAHAIIAESQTGGRGRRQRQWHSPPGGNIYLSLGWQFEPERMQSVGAALSSLPLVVAVSLCQSLDTLGLDGHGIKWPNDIVAGGKKLAGVLVEMQSSGEGPLLAIIGVGLNVDMPGGSEPEIERPWTDLRRLVAERVPDRNTIAAGLIDGLMSALKQFSTSGLAPYREEWERRDVLAGKRVHVEQAGEVREGRAKGIDADGALRVISVDGESLLINSGEVSVRYG
jgi:BirA family biotin operon repressor/biotin-[acetyl-CoA-carboxylase] ligase